MKELKLWPLGGLDKESIMEDLKDALSGNINYGKDLIIGFPGTSPDPFAADAFNIFMRKHPNNICTHTYGESEKGFEGTQHLERQVIFMLADLLGADSVDGYITPGGTEANIMGILLGRESLRDVKSKQDGYCLITSIFAHYSIRKAAWLLGLGRDHWNKCSHCSDLFQKDIHHLYDGSTDHSKIQLVGTDDAGRISVEQVESVIRTNYVNGIRRFIIVTTEGSTMTGSIDDTEKIGELIRNLKEELPDAGFYFHVDAAFGGLVIPFLATDYNYCFYVPEVDSITVDFHKTGEAPYPAGIFIYRKDNRKFNKLLGVQMGYVPGGADGTLCGSRSGAAAAACYALIKNRGYEGYQLVVEKCMDNTEYLKERLTKISEIEVLPNDMNVIAFRIKGAQDRELSREFELQTFIVFHRYPLDFSNPDDHVKMIYKATIMSHVAKSKIDKFISLLKKELDTSKKEVSNG